MHTKPLPPTPSPKQEQSTPDGHGDLEATQNQKTVINPLRRGYWKVKRKDGKARSTGDNETSVEKKLESKNAGETSTREEVEKVPHDPAGTDWKNEYDKLQEEMSHVQGDLEHLRNECDKFQAEIKERARDFEGRYKDPLYGELPTERNFPEVIKILLENYHFRIKDREHAKDRYQNEHKRCIGLDDALRAKDGELKRQRATHEKFLEVDCAQEQAQRRGLEIKVHNLEAMLAGSADEIERLTSESREALRTLRKSLEDAHKTEMDRLKQEHKNYIQSTEEARELETKNFEKTHKTELDSMKDEMEHLKAQHAVENHRREEQYAKEIRTLKGQNASLEGSHTNSLREQEAKHRSELSKAQEQRISLEQAHVAELETREQARTKDVSELEAKIASLMTEHSTELNTRSSTQATELKARDRVHAEEELKLKDRMILLQTDHSAVLKNRDNAHAAAISKLKKQFRDHLAQREKEHANATEALRATIGEYSGALLERDKTTYNMFEGKLFEPLLDVEVETRFVELTEEVDTLSRLDWKANPSGWPEPVLLRLSRNQKTLKRQILKDTIWVILHDFVFCSPFRVFGDEGRALEAKWNEECGADDTLDNGLYIWPKPSMKTERWRYVTIRECRAALQKPTPSPYDPLAKPRKGFQTSIKTIKEELVTAVGSLVPLNQTNIQDLEKIAMRAARTWLEFGLQRYRLNVLMQGENIRSIQGKVEKLKDGLALVVAPTLVRFGTAKGEELDEKEVVGECVGEVVTLRL
ncbi:hypothetical protein IQ07DRAFT_583093 [Pyrenochaeta sp. DS3sAY3a]|nr:hypothetical protein IQ07DRAFT_583093 [Pyrenochaeta sp. DS3sAY3a]